mgnify:CR=1 FL=1
MSDRPTARLDYRDGCLCAVQVTRDSLNPVEWTTWWPLFWPRVTRSDVAYWIGREAHDDGPPTYTYSVPLGELEVSGWKQFQLPFGGETLPLAVDERPVLPPTVRRGIETRWRNGRWEKYLKTKGWVTA